MIAYAIGVSGVLLTIAGIIMRTAPLGWEDCDGFHLGPLVGPEQLPSQHTHHLSDNASERRGDGEGISFDHMKGNDQ